ncbi:MAG: hypothetical protein ACYDGO_09110 [Smithellaceae bacterium]
MKNLHIDKAPNHFLQLKTAGMGAPLIFSMSEKDKMHLTAPVVRKFGAGQPAMFGFFKKS